MDPNTTPGLQPPPGQVSNLNGPSPLVSQMYVAAGLGLGLATLAVILRFFTKVRVLRSVQLEEYILVFSLLGFFAFTFLMIHAVHLGQGAHQWNVSVADVQRVIQLSNIIEVIYCPVILGAKVAMLLQMRRMFVVNKKGKLLWLHEILLWANVLCYFTLMLTFSLACIPREKLWKPEIPGHCISSTVSLIGSSSLNVVSDISMLLLPISVIMRLQLPLKSKLILCAVFGTGILACASSTLRLVYGVRMTETEDFTRAIAPVGLWAIGEICSVILAGSIPMLPGFVKFVRGKDDHRSGSSLPRSRLRWPTHLSSTAARHLPLRDNDGLWRDSFVRMGTTTEAHVSASALIDPQKEELPLSIMKTVHVETKSSSD